MGVLTVQFISVFWKASDRKQKDYTKNGLSSIEEMSDVSSRLGESFCSVQYNYHNFKGDADEGKICSYLGLFCSE